MTAIPGEIYAAARAAIGDRSCDDCNGESHSRRVVDAVAPKLLRWAAEELPLPSGLHRSEFFDGFGVALGQLDDLAASLDPAHDTTGDPQ